MEVRSGWLHTPEDVRILALETVQKRAPGAKHHPEIKLRWGQQLDRVRALRGSKGNYQAIKLFFDNIYPSPSHL